MILTFVLLWTVTVILIMNNTMKKDYLRWAALMTFVAGCGGFARALVESFLPFLETYHFSSASLSVLFHEGYIIGSILNQNGLPYAFLMFSICYCGFYSTRVKKSAAFLLLLPIAATLTQTQLFPTLSHPFKIMFIWVFPYILTATILLVYSVVQEQNPYLRKDRMFVLLVALPPVLSQLIWNYTLRMFEMNDIWRFNSITITLLFLIFIGIATRNGFIGIKLKLGNIRLDNTMKATFNGTMVLNHTLKNEIGKIQILNERIKYYIRVAPDFNRIEKDSETIHQLCQHVLEMVQSIQNRMQSIELRESKCRFTSLIEHSMMQMTPLFEQKNITVIADFCFDAVIRCDRVHVIEVLLNVLRNAVEAMKESGTLTLRTFETNKGGVIEIRDDGCGISEADLHKIFDPFYSTKQREHNYGLGLSYCYNVMREHNGFIKASSEGKGTTFSLGLPNSRIERLD